MLTKRFVVAAVAAFATFAMVPAAQSAEPTYTVGAGGTYRPFEFETPQKELTGFDIDLIKAIGKAGGFNVKLVNSPFEGIFAALAQGDRDIIISGLTITEQRKKTVDFSAPYFPASQVIIAAPSAKIGGLAELKTRQVGVVASSAGDTAVSEELGRTSSAIKRFDNTPLMLEELYRGGVDAAVGDVGVIKFYVKSHPEKKFSLVTDAKFKPQYFGIAVKKGNKVVLDQVNAGLKKIIADGTYAKIYKQWFDDNVPTLPQQ